MIQGREKLITKNIVVCLGAVFCCVLWGSAVPTIKIGYKLFDIASKDSATQILFAGIRFTLAGILTIIFGSIPGKKLLYPAKTSWGNIFVLSMLQTVIQYVLFYIGLAHTTGVKSSIVLGVGVFVAVFVSAVIFRSEKLTKNKLIGSFIGIAGIITVNLSGASEGLTSFTLSGDGLIIISTISYAISSSCIKIFSKKESPVTLSGYQFFMGGIIMTIFGIIAGGKLSAISAKGISILIYLAFVSAAAYTLWGILLKYNPVSKVAIYGFMNPLCGVILSAVLLNENAALGFPCIAALVLVCTGIFIANKS